jgi:hypothetical protein
MVFLFTEYLHSPQNLCISQVKTKAGTIELSAPKALFEVAVHNLSGRWYDVSPDGRFLMNASRPTTQTQNFELVVNWPAELK